MQRHTISLSVSVILLLATTTADASAPGFLWSQRFGGTGTDIGNAVAIDGSGNIFVTGDFSASVNFGGGSLNSAGADDVFLAKYDANGAHQWSRRFGSASPDVGHAVAVDGSGNVFLAGDFQGTVNFGGSSLVSAGSTDIFLAKYDANGTHQWSQRFGSTGSDAVRSVAIDGSGNVVVTGYFYSTVNFGGGNLVSAGDADIFLAKYNTGGTHQSSLRFGGTLGDYGYKVLVDGSGNTVLAGFYYGTLNLGGGNLVSAGQNDIFLAKYGADGVHQWSQRFGGTSNDVGFSAAVDGSGNIFLTGYFAGTTNLGGGNLISAGSFDIFLAKYNTGGVHQWSQRFGSAGGADFGYSVAADGSGNVLTTGSFVLAVNFGGGDLVSVSSTDDIFLASYDTNGIHQWSQRYGSVNVDAGRTIAMGGSGRFVVTGNFQDTVDFGSGNLVSAGGNDIFLAEYSSNVAEPLITSITDVANDQGRRVRIAFTRAALDDGAATTPVVRYEAFLRDDPTPLAAAGPMTAAGSRDMLSGGWLEVASISAHAEDEYLMDAPTDADSTQAFGQHYSVFFIRAATEEPSVYFDSAPDSGYSLDNLAPGVPLNLLYNEGQLSWDESSAEDFDFFTVYGSNTDDFGAATVVDYSVAPGMDVTASPYVFYFVTATDFSGNEGPPAKVYTLSGVGGTPKSYVLSVSNYPNPFNPRTTVSYTVPSRATVTVAIYDARGARVATLVNREERGPGAYRVDWDGRAGDGVTAASGVYFARIEHASGTTRSRKMILIK